MTPQTNTYPKPNPPNERHSYDPSTPPQDQLGQPWMVQRVWASIDPIFSPSSVHLACNDPGDPPTSYIPIRAGDDITAVYWYWLHPVGPMSVWLAACGEDADCRDVDVSQADWFKIWHAGLLEGPNLAEGLWWQKRFQRWDGSPGLWPVTIPPALKPGLYMIRHEILSIHVADKPQFYPECAHLNVSGTGDALPPSEFLKKFPGAYEVDGMWIFPSFAFPQNKGGEDIRVCFNAVSCCRPVDYNRHIQPREQREHGESATSVTASTANSAIDRQSELHDSRRPNMGRVSQTGCI